VHGAINLEGLVILSQHGLPYLQNMPVCSIVATLLQLLNPEDEGPMILHNVGNWPADTV